MSNAASSDVSSQEMPFAQCVAWMVFTDPVFVRGSLLIADIMSNFVGPSAYPSATASARGHSAPTDNAFCDVPSAAQ
jgi:hypothetical protein